MSIFFESVLSKIESRNIIKIPLNSSKQLPSRGMVMIQGTINGFAFIVPAEPDGKGSHWFELSEELCKETGILPGQPLSFTVESLGEWIEPDVPADIMDAILNAGLLVQWNSLTVKARWEWIRWIRSTKNPKTRQNRIEVACSKLLKNDRRPCCFDTTRCTVPELSKSGVLLDQ